jgi:hypothetical protein
MKSNAQVLQEARQAREVLQRQRQEIKEGKLNEAGVYSPESAVRGLAEMPVATDIKSAIPVGAGLSAQLTAEQANPVGAQLIEKKYPTEDIYDQVSKMTIPKLKKFAKSKDFNYNS